MGCAKLHHQKRWKNNSPHRKIHQYLFWRQGKKLSFCTAAPFFREIFIHIRKNGLNLNLVLFVSWINWNNITKISVGITRGKPLALLLLKTNIIKHEKGYKIIYILIIRFLYSSYHMLFLILAKFTQNFLFAPLSFLLYTVNSVYTVHGVGCVMCLMCLFGKY